MILPPFSTVSRPPLGPRRLYRGASQTPRETPSAARFFHCAIWTGRTPTAEASSLNVPRRAGQNGVHYRRPKPSRRWLEDAGIQPLGREHRSQGLLDYDMISVVWVGFYVSGS